MKTYFFYVAVMAGLMAAVACLVRRNPGSRGCLVPEVVVVAPDTSSNTSNTGSAHASSTRPVETDGHN